MPILEVNNLKTYFHTRDGIVRAVDGVSFPVEKGQTVGIVGESGSGKSVTCYSLLGLIPTPPGKVEDGSAIFDGTDLLKCTEDDLCNIRGKRISMIFQDPMTCLNPYLRISTQITEPLRIHMGMDKKTAKKEAVNALREVGIPEPEKRVDMYLNNIPLNIELDRIKELINRGIGENILFIKAEDLTNDPGDVMSSLYDRLKVENFNHDFSNVEQTTKENDIIHGLDEDLHKIRSEVKPLKSDAVEILGPELCNFIDSEY